MNCSDIVTCLRKDGVKPLAFAKTERSAAENANVAIDYSLINSELLFNSLDEPNQWWAIDFKQYVIIESYQIKVDRFCNFIGNWVVKLSNNNITWTNPVSSGTDYPYNNKPIKLNDAYYTRYFKIEGGAKRGCDVPNYLAFFQIKFSGKILKSFNTCKCRKHYNKHLSLAESLIFLVLYYK